MRSPSSPGRVNASSGSSPISPSSSRIEYSAPRSLLSGYATGPLRWVLARGTRPEEVPVRPALPAAVLREALDRRDRALRVFLETYERGAPRSSMKEAVARYVEALRNRT